MNKNNSPRIPTRFELTKSLIDTTISYFNGENRKLKISIKTYKDVLKNSVELRRMYNACLELGDTPMDEHMKALSETAEWIDEYFDKYGDLYVGSSDSH